MLTYALLPFAAIGLIVIGSELWYELMQVWEAPIGRALYARAVARDEAFLASLERAS